MNTQTAITRINEYLATVQKAGKPVISCQICQKDLCPGDDDWRRHVVRRERVLAKVVPLVSEHPRVYLHEYICPGCGAMLETQIVLHEE